MTCHPCASNACLAIITCQTIRITPIVVAMEAIVCRTVLIRSNLEFFSIDSPMCWDISRCVLLWPNVGKAKATQTARHRSLKQPPSFPRGLGSPETFVGHHPHPRGTTGNWRSICSPKSSLFCCESNPTPYPLNDPLPCLSKK